MVVFQHERGGVGAECRLTVDGSSVRHTEYGVHDGLGELIRAACEMLGRADDATARFEEEPGEYRWRLTRMSGNRVRVRVIEFDAWGTGRPDATGRLLFDQPCGAVAFARAIYAGSMERKTTPEYQRLGSLLRQYDFSGGVES